MADIAQRYASLFPFDESVFQRYTLHLDTESFGGSGGGALIDRTLADAQPVDIAYFDSIDTYVLILSFSEITGNGSVPEQLYLLSYDEEDAKYTTEHSPDGYFTRYQEDTHWQLTLDDTTNPINGMLSYRYLSQGGGDYDFFLTQVGAPTPDFTSIRGERLCEGSVRTFTEIGDRMRVLYTVVSYGDGDNPIETHGQLLFSSQLGQFIVTHIEPDTVVTIVSGHECDGSDIWWEVELEDGTFGWLRENSGSLYLLLPE